MTGRQITRTAFPGWRRSAAFREVAVEAIRAWNRKRAGMPKCGAVRRHDGEPCQQIAMANGRCHYHGGKTPKGDAWHRPRWPNGNSPDAEAKLQRKLHDLSRAQKAREKRLAAMTAAERQRYDAWLRTHKPGPAASRAAAKLRRQQDLEGAALLASAPKPDSLELAEVKARLAAVRSEIAAMKAAIAAQREAEQGVFG